MRPAPLVITIGALDGRKEDHVGRGEYFLPRGIAMFSFDMPGTGEAPIKIDVGAQRIYSRVLDYLRTRPEIDAKRDGARWKLERLLGGEAGLHRACAPQGRRRAGRTGALLFPAGVAEDGPRHAGIPLRPVSGPRLRVRRQFARRIPRLWSAPVAQGRGIPR